MANLQKAYQELFKRTPDETYDSFKTLTEDCRLLKERAVEVWHAREDLVSEVGSESVQLQLGSDSNYGLNHWSFS